MNYLEGLSYPFKENYKKLTAVEKKILKDIEYKFLSNLRDVYSPSLKTRNKTGYENLLVWLDYMEELNDLQQGVVTTSYHETLDTLIAYWDEQIRLPNTSMKEGN